MDHCTRRRGRKQNPRGRKQNPRGRSCKYIHRRREGGMIGLII
jgi:hypothetical protein